MASEAPSNRMASVPMQRRRSARPLSVVARSLIRRAEFGAFAALVVVYGFFAIFAGDKGFLSLAGTASWLNTASELGVVAIPFGMLLIAGEFDLSIGSVIGASAMVVAIGSGFFSLPLWLSILLALAVGVLVGLGNGLLTVRTGLPSFIVTLAGLFIVAGAALGFSRLFTGTTAVSLTPSGFVQTLFGSQVHGYHVSILWWIGVALVASWVLGQTPVGNWIFATGGDEGAARSAGVPTDWIKIGLFMATAFAAALVGVLQAIQYQGGDVTYGKAFVFDAPVSVVIGGVLLTGGYGSAIGAFIGTMIFGIVDLGVFYTGWNTDWAQLVLGALLVLAVIANNYFRKLALKAG